MNIMELLQNRKDFTAAENEIAKYILADPEAVSAMAVNELAESVYCSNATVIRMVRKLGLPGYKEFRIELAKEAERRKKERIEVDIDEPFFHHAGADVIMKNLSNIKIQAIEETHEVLSYRQIDDIGKMMVKARNIYICADGDTEISCIAFENNLNKIGKLTSLIRRYNDSVGIANFCIADDIALFVSYSGSSVKACRKEIQLFRKNRCPTIMISTLERLPGIDHSIRIPLRERMVGKSAGYYSQESVRFVLDTLYGVIYSYDLENNRKRKTEAEQIANFVNK